MLYLAHIVKEQLAAIPRTGAELDATQTATMTLTSTVERRSVYTVQVRLGGRSKLYHYAYVTLPSTVLVGEYEYTLTQEGLTVASGIARVGRYVPAQKEATGSIEFRQGK